MALNTFIILSMAVCTTLISGCDDDYGYNNGYYNNGYNNYNNGYDYGYNNGYNNFGRDPYCNDQAIRYESDDSSISWGRRCRQQNPWGYNYGYNYGYNGYNGYNGGYNGYNW